MGLALLALFGMIAAAWLPDTAQRSCVATAAEGGPGISAPNLVAGPSANGAAGLSYARTLSIAFREAAGKTLPAVVSIRSLPALTDRSSGQRPSPEDDFDHPFGELFRRNPDLRRFFGDLPPLPRIPRGRGFRLASGSGVIIDPSGIVLTNNHVVEGAGRLVVRLQDGREFKASDIKRDLRTDLAILRLDGKGPFPSARLGNSDQTQVGDWVLALGQPFGLEGTVTAGIISAKGRGLGITPRESFLQTDAAINPGSSGGPLVNLDGEVIGLNTAISTETGGNQGVGFAIPINLAKWVVDQLIKRGTVQRAYLGVSIQQVTSELAERFGIQPNKGVLVGEVRSNSPAAKAGLKPGDVILEFNGQPVANPTELQGLVEQVTIGATLPLTVLREGKRLTVNVTYEEQPRNYGLPEEDAATEASGSESTAIEKLGLEVSNLTADVAEKLGVAAGQGVVVTRVSPGSPAQLAGLAPGMVILEVNRQPVRSVQQFRAAVTDQALAKGLLLLVRTERGTRFVVVQMPT